MKKLLLSIVALLMAGVSFAQSDIYYSIAFPHPEHHEAEITLRVGQIPDGPFKIRMSRSSAGRYATHEFGKNVYNVKAFDGAGKELALKQIEGDVWELTQHPESVK